MPLSDPYAKLNRRALKAISFAELTNNESSVAGLQKTGGKHNKLWWSRGSLGAEQDSRLLASPDWVRIRSLNLLQKRIELTGWYSFVPRL
jgi:hypothetical protein